MALRGDTELDLMVNVGQCVFNDLKMAWLLREHHPGGKRNGEAWISIHPALFPSLLLIPLGTATPFTPDPHGNLNH